MLWRNIRCWLVGWKLWLGGGNDLISWRVICFGLTRTGVIFFWRNWRVLLIGFVFFFLLCSTGIYPDFSLTRRNRYIPFGELI